MAALRPGLSRREGLLFDLLRAAGDLGFRLPTNANLREVSGPLDPRRRLAKILGRLRRESGPGTWSAARDRLARKLAVELAARGDGPSRPLRVLVAYAAGALAPDGLPPTDPLLAAAFGTVILVFERLYGSGIHPLGRLPFVGRRHLAQLLAETRANARRGRKSSGRRPGLRGRELAVDPRLMEAVGRAAGKRVAPGLEARYLFYAKPGDCFWPHPDDPKYAMNVLLCLDRRPPDDGGPASCFYAFRSDGRRRRIDLRPGEALAVAARGVVHGREPLRRGERVTLLSIELLWAGGRV